MKSSKITYINNLKTLTYDSMLFDTSFVHEINLFIDKEDLEDLLNDPLKKENYHCDIFIDRKLFRDVAVSVKGTLTLRSAIKTSTHHRYSFKIHFNKYHDKQTYYGLDTLNLNSEYTDDTHMRDYITYYMFRNIGVPAPLAGYVSLKINDRLYGLYLAVENIEYSYRKRCHNGKGELYKPEARQITDLNLAANRELRKAMKHGTLHSIPKLNNPNGIPSLRDYTTGADLRYTNDAPDSYCDIFDHAVTDPDSSDKKRVIEALQKLSSSHPEEAVNSEEVMKYFVVHNFTNNFDSYTGKLNHNYFLYEHKGKLQMIPWDYNSDDVMCTAKRAPSITQLSGYTIDSDINHPLALGIPKDSRPMWSWIADQENYLSQYHKYYDEFLSGLFESGKIYDEIHRVDKMIQDDVKNDPTAHFSVEEYRIAVDDMIQYCKLRSASIRNQLTLRNCQRQSPSDTM